MIRLKFSRDNNGVTFTAETQSPTSRLFARKSEKIGNVDTWVAGNVAGYDAFGALRVFGEENPASVRFDSDQVFASHAAIASLNINQANALGLPNRAPFVLTTDTKGVLGSPNFQLRALWRDAGRTLPHRRQGAFLETGKGVFLIPEPAYSVLEHVDEFDASSLDLASQWKALAKFRTLLGSVNHSDDYFELNEYLSNLRIYTGAALSLSLKGDADDIDFDPILFEAAISNSARFEGRTIHQEDGMLPDQELQVFQLDNRTGFRAFVKAKGCYLLGHSTYVIVDEDLETALQVIREKQQASPIERKAFATNPRAEIADRIAELVRDRSTAEEFSDDSLEEEIESRMAELFVETPEYADRAYAIGLWEPPSIDIPSQTRNSWLPETFALELDGVWVRLDPETIPELREAIDEAIERGEESIEFQGEVVPATPSVRDKLSEVIATEVPDDSGQDDFEDSREDEELPELPQPTVVKVHENFIEENWAPPSQERPVRIAQTTPQIVSTAMLLHQAAALKWQISAWSAGYLGILNADDQGLGKTLQTLAFLAWLQENMAEGSPKVRKPILIVAPAGLLRVWEAEEQMHLSETRMGNKILVHGEGLHAFRQQGLPGRDTDDGVPRLQFADLLAAIAQGEGHSSWVLTTYETLTNYQHSFRTIDFSVAVFDEIQKIKNPKTLSAAAVRTVKADFRIGLTGTPLENNVVDLWAIMDAIAPGRLGSLEDYLDRYGVVTEECMSELHARLFKPVKHRIGTLPPIAQRRFKEDEIEDLPLKKYRLYPATMPNAQASAYQKALELLPDGSKGSVLQILHHIRGVSLHPEPPELAFGGIDEYFADSARFDQMYQVLNRIKDRRERVLIFTENRRIQGFVAQWLQSEFSLSRVRIINGATSIARRRQYVSEFQKNMLHPSGFDAMILSPRAAGVGLTLTAATHVIHLSRWWNPAVEEQCNDRIYRIGQTNDVTIHVPLAVHPAYCESSFDCVLNNLMRRKTSLARAALWPPILDEFDNQQLLSGVMKVDSIDVDQFSELDWAAFEDWTMQRALSSGDWKVSDTPRSGDAGSDMVLRHRRRPASSALVQVKHTTNRKRLIGETAIEEVLHSSEKYAVRDPQLAVISNASGFTQGARDLAQKNDVRIVDRDRLGLWPVHVLA